MSVVSPNWPMDRPAAEVVIATDGGVFRFNVETGALEKLVPGLQLELNSPRAVFSSVQVFRSVQLLRLRLLLLCVVFCVLQYLLLLNLFPKFGRKFLNPFYKPIFFFKQFHMTYIYICVCVYYKFTPKYITINKLKTVTALNNIMIQNNFITIYYNQTLSLQHKIAYWNQNM